MLSFILVFVGTLIAMTAGVFLTLWCSHVAKTGCSPLPSIPQVRLFKRAQMDEDDDEPAQKKNGQHRVGP